MNEVLEIMQEKVEGFRLSPQQKRVWLLQQENPAAYCGQCAVSLTGELRTEILRQAIARLISRHEILRTTFRGRPGLRAPFQVISNSAPAPEWRFVDLIGSGEEKQRESIERLLARDCDQPWEYDAGPLLRLLLARLSAREHLLLVTLPALCADSQTLSLFAGELARAYTACLTDRDLLDEPTQYVQFSEWQNELLEEKETAVGQTYWREQDWSACARLRLPFESATGAETGAVLKVERRAVELSEGELEELAGAARAHGASVEAWLQACWTVLLWRLSGQPSEIFVGVKRNGREYEELQHAMGLFSQTVPVKIRFERHLRFSEALGRLDELVQEACEWYESLNSERVRRAAVNSSGATGSGGAPETFFCAAQYEYETAAPPLPSPAPGLTFSISRLAALAEPFKVKLHVAERHPSPSPGEKISGGPGARASWPRLELLWDSAFLTEEAASCLASQLRALIHHSVADPLQLITAASLMTEAERRRALVEWNDTVREYGSERVHEMFEAQAERSPESLAVVCEEQRLTYKELNERANQLARSLRDQGVGAESRVALLMERSVEAVVSLLAVLKAGGAYVPLDPQYPPERLSFMLTDSGASVLLTQSSLRNTAPRNAAQVVERVVEVDTEWGQISGQRGQNLEAVAEAANLAYVIYTSGSTGRPKGVMVEHRQLSNYVGAATERLSLPAGASYATVSTFAADLGHTMIFPALCGGGTLHVLTRERSADAVSLREYMTSHGVDCLKIVPSHLEALCEGVGSGEVQERGGGQGAGRSPVGQLRRLVLGGEASRWSLIDRLKKLMPGCEIYNHYGPTETTVGAVAQILVGGEMERAGQVGLGRPMGNMRAYVLREEMTVSGVGETGELYIGGAGVGRGYLGRAELTAERYVPDPFCEVGGGRLYRTGDVARYRPDGAIEYLGRVDNQIKIRGFRIEMGEIETTLISHPSISEAVVIAREDVPGEKRLIAYVVSVKRQSPALGGELRAYLKERLPEYMLPQAFIQMDALPLTLNGKVDRQMLPLPERVKVVSANAHVAPRTPLEEVLCGVWREVLEAERVGVTDNFFELGGHSLLVTQVISRVREIFRIELPVRKLFDAATIEQMSHIIIENETKPGQAEKIAQTLNTIRNMPEQERRKILQQKRKEKIVA